MTLEAFITGAMLLGFGYYLGRHFGTNKPAPLGEADRINAWFDHMAAVTKPTRDLERLRAQRAQERSRSHYWLSRERDNRRAWMYRAFALEEELQVYRKEAEERLWN